MGRRRLPGDNAREGSPYQYKAKLHGVLGRLLGSGFNAYYASKVCDAAYFPYRERFLAEKYGPSAIEITVDPADDLDPHYEISDDDDSREHV